MRPGATGSHRVVEVVQDRHGNLIEIYDPPFYRKEFEDAYRFIIDDYQVAPREIGLLLPRAAKPTARPEPRKLFR